ncbi:hypothetical protein NP493_805g01004 [Ridgeia piscesae]|uniref:Uncharacterized protein n=1 Tax=Ridgeia piscesae TaxID=27915 RepID=A0AAD9KPQ4_RIDPI|nr:hypothetical protein NP493_805g01004 [Ridgeia piscesae]
MIGKFACNCSFAYTGYQCQTEVDQCESNPCQQNGICYPEVAGFECDCPSGTSGAVCQENINECASQPCNHGGRCANLLGSFTCNCAKGYKGPTCALDAVQIEDVKAGQGATKNGVYEVNGTGIKDVYCDLETDGGGWTVEKKVKKKITKGGGAAIDEDQVKMFVVADGISALRQLVEMKLERQEYIGYDDWNHIHGDRLCYHDDIDINDDIGVDMGNIPEESWGGSELYVELTDYEDETRVARYGKFAIGSESDKYKLIIDEYKSSPNDAGDSLTYHKDQPFSTHDRDSTEEKCATKRHGAWWYVCCLNSNLNGKYEKGFSFSLMVWQTWKGMASVKSTKMMMRPVGYIPYKDECKFYPCENSGTCFDEIHGYRCECTMAYVGINCTIEVNECDSSPCLHGGSCLNQLGMYECSCADGYEGDHCETDTDECTSLPCQRGGTCTDKVNGYDCSCPPGFSPPSCSIGKMEYDYILADFLF